MNQELQNKINFVKELNQVVTKNVRSLKSISYEVFVDDTNDRVREFVKVTFVGDAYEIRNTTHDSISAILSEIGKLIDGGYYDEVDYYVQYCMNKNYQHISSTD